MTAIRAGLPCRDQIYCRSSDACAEYADAWYCYSCHKQFYKRIKLHSQKCVVQKDDYIVELPPSCTTVLPKSALLYLADRFITPSHVEQYRIVYNTDFHSLIFPFVDENDNLIAYYERGLTKKTHYYAGKHKLLYWATAPVPGSVIVLVEDIFSAIRVGQFLPCAALCTSSVGAKKLEILELNPRKVILWYDPDDAGQTGMLKDFIEFSNYVPTERILSLLDPKMHTNNEIENYLAAVI